MSKKCDWNVQFIDGTEVSVRASSKRMAEAQASVKTGRSPDEIRYPYKTRGKPRNGKKAHGSGRSYHGFGRSFQERHGMSSRFGH